MAARRQDGGRGDRSLGQGSRSEHDLKKWFGHDASRWPEFRRRYNEELRGHAARLRELRALARQHPITLVYSAHDELHNDAVVLREVLLGR
jgi:uncharacterized protein YeaO (DUF488 family)